MSIQKASCTDSSTSPMPVILSIRYIDTFQLWRIAATAEPTVQTPFKELNVEVGHWICDGRRRVGDDLKMRY
jgi:hypothetical protein